MWTTVLVALIVALSTLGATFIGNRLSSKRFEMELTRQREVDKRQRKWIVRSEPLLKLRDELAVMATKQNRMIIAVEEDDEKKLQEALDDWNNYEASGSGLYTLLKQYDTELYSQVWEIYENYIEHFKHYKELKGAEREKAERSLGETWHKVIGVQELINKRLEEL